MNLYPHLLGARFDQLPKQVRAFHDANGVTTWTGTAKVRRGANPIARLACHLFRFPPAGDAVPLTLTITPGHQAERWDRNFGGTVMSTVQSATADGYLTERLGPVHIIMSLDANGDRFSVRPERWTIIGLPMPRALMPDSENFETDINGTFTFDVSISAPLLGPIVSYQGQLKVTHV